MNQNAGSGRATNGAIFIKAVFGVTLVLATAAKLWLASSRPLEAIGWAHYDDRWFLQRAIDILEGRWLGEYNHLTLIKGPMYPLWVALMASQRIPLLFAQQCLYALACLSAVIALASAIRSRIIQGCLFVVLLFNPVSLADDVATRVSREAVYPALTLFVFAAAAGTMLRLERRSSWLWSVFAGASIAVFWNTREEGVWILPLLGSAGIALLLWMLRDRASRWRQALLIVALPALIVTATHVVLILINGSRYGIFEVVEFKEKSFLRAYGSLTHVRQHPPQPRIPVPKETRARIYAVSPAFAELQSHLEGALGERWKRGGDELPGESFMWAFRESVDRSGYYSRGGQSVREYCDRISREIDAARVAGLLEARPARATLLPPILKGQRRQTLRVWWRSLLRLPRFLDAGFSPRFSEGLNDELREYADMTRSRLAPIRQKRTARAHLIGWAIHINGYLDLKLERADGTAITEGRVTRLPSPDLYEHLKRSWKEFPPARHSRFDIDTPTEDAYLVLSLHGRVVERMSLASYRLGVNDPNVRMVIDQSTYTDILPRAPLPRDPLLETLGTMARAYQLVFPPLLIIASLLYWPNVKRLALGRGDWTLPLLIAGLIAAIAGRLLILSLIDVTSFAVFTPGYLASLPPLMLIVGIVTLFDGIEATRSRLGSSSRSDSAAGRE